MSKGLAFKVGDKNTKITNPLKLIFPFVRIRYGRKLYKELVRRFGEQLHIVKQNHYIEVVSKRADKGTAIKFLVKYLHYDNPNLYNTISIGDSENDVEMFNETNRKYVVAQKISKSPLLTYDYPIIGNADYNAVGKILQSLMDEDAHDEQLSTSTKVIAPISAAKKETEPKEISPVSKHQVLVKKES
ncbi:HAD hydrolase family protein [bacterium]|nr:HAD hydrolase family protein [bacterium]